jgi:chorismate mutase/prephenate dehydratase
MPDTTPPAAAGPTPGPTPGDAELAALRAEIDTLDDAIHDLLMRRVGVVARLAASRAKGKGPAIRPGREAMILRRLLARHGGPLPRAGLVRLWRELLCATTSMQAPLTAAAWLPDAGVEVLRAHLGLAAPVTHCAGEAAAIEAATSGATALAALPPAGRWWLTLDPARLFVTARLPFFGVSDATVFLLSPTPPDASGDDRSLARIPAAAAEALAAAGLAPTLIAQQDEFLLVELPGMIAAHDERLAALGGTLLGAYAAPVTA